jgi:hypothetical protein
MLEKLTQALEILQCLCCFQDNAGVVPDTMQALFLFFPECAAYSLPPER